MGRGLDFVDNRSSGVDTHLSSKGSNGCLRGILRHGYAALPAIHCRERYAKPLGQLILGQVKPYADGLQGWGNVLFKRKFGHGKIAEYSGSFCEPFSVGLNVNHRHCSTKLKPCY